MERLSRALFTPNAVGVMWNRLQRAVFCLKPIKGKSLLKKPFAFKAYISFEDYKYKQDLEIQILHKVFLHYTRIS